MVFRQLARDSAIYGGSDFVFKLIAFWTFPLIAAALTPRAFGALELLLTATALLGMLANCGLNNSLQRFYWDAQTELHTRPILVSSGLATLVFFTLVAAFIVGIAMLLFTRWSDAESALLGWSGLLASLVLMVAGQLVQYLLDVTRLHMAPWHFAGIAMASRVMTAFAGVVAVVWFAGGLDGLLVAQAVVMVLTIPLALYVVRSDLTLRVDMAIVRKLVQFGHPFIYAGLAFWLFSSMDRWMLASLSSIEEVGIYSVANRFASVVLFVSMAFGQAWSPIAIKIRAEHPHSYRTLYVNILLALMWAMTLLGGSIALFAPEIVVWMMPAEYHGAGLVLAILTLGLILQSTMQVTAVGISIETKTYLFARLSWAATALNFLLNLVMIPTLGALGAAVATSLTYLFLTGAYLYFTQKLHPLPLPWSQILGFAALWLAITASLIGMQLKDMGANSLVTRAMLMLTVLLVSTALIPWRMIVSSKYLKV
jgi:O-antigen/teichoic acid export membrane protein